MKLIVKTEILKNMVAKAKKGIGNNKLSPLSELMCISFDNDTLNLTVSTGNEIMRVKHKAVDDDIVFESSEFNVVIKTDIFPTLISKTTSKTVELEYAENCLTVTGNGVYKIDIPTDTETKTAYDDKNNCNNDKVFIENAYATIAADKIRDVIRCLSCSLSTDFSTPCYTNYYVKDNGVIATDAFQLSKYITDLQIGEYLFSPTLFNLLAVTDCDDLNVYNDGDNFVFIADDVVVYSKEMPYKESYNIDTLNKLLNSVFANKLNISKTELLNALDRLSSFTNKFEKTSYIFTAIPDNNKLVISNSLKNASEYINSVTFNITDNTISAFALDIERLKSIIKTLASDNVSICFGGNSFIGITDGDVKHILCTCHMKEN